MDTLILNKDGEPLNLLPLSLIDWQTAIRLAYQEKLIVLHEYSDWVVRSPSVTMKVPSVVMMREYIKHGRVVRYSRNNIFLRDNYTCQLCNGKPKITDLSLDHVVPKSKGGKTHWGNIITCCKACNEAKGNNEKIVPAVMPRRPSYYEMVAKRQQYSLTIKDRSWLNYLSWPGDKIIVKEHNSGKNQS